MHWPSVVVLVLAVTVVHPSSAAINSSSVIEIVRKLNDVYRFETLPIFWSSSIQHRKSLLVDLSLELSTEYLLPLMQFVAPSNEELRYLLNRDILSIVITDQMTTEVLKIAQLRLRGMHQSKLLLVIRDPVELNQLDFFRNWLWENQFVNVLVVFEDGQTNLNQLFTINPYPTLKWLNRTNATDPSKLFMEETKDLKQYQIEIPFTEDPPRVFLYKKAEKNGKFRVVGRHGNLIKLFAQWMNINLICHYEPNIDLDKILRIFHNKEMEISVHTFSMFDLEEIGSSYPLETVRWCIMVPLRSEVPKSEYVIIAFDTATWYVIGFSIVYIAFLMRFIDPPTANTQKLYFLRSLAILMYSPNMAERMTAPTIRQFIFFSLVFLLGFILSCIYSTYVTSYCTNMVFQPPIDTVADLVKENLRVMVIDYELEAIRTRATYGEMFLKILYPVSYVEVNKLRNNFDGRYAYSIRQDRWNFLDKQQRGLEKPFFRLSKICFGRHYTMFPLHYDSHLQMKLDYFILLIMQAGLDVFWDEEAFRMAVASKVSKVLVEQTVVIQKLRLDYFKHVYAIWSVGIAISTVCFAVEVLWIKFLSVKRLLQRAQRIDRGLEVDG